MNNGKEHTGWRLIPLCEAAEVTMGSSPPGESYNDDGQGVPLINGPVEFSEGDFGFTIRGKSTTEPTRMCRTDDLLLCVRGSTTGRTNIAGFEACIGRGVASIRAKEDQRFLNHFIRTQRQRLFDLGNGSTFPSITQEQLTSVKVPLPPLHEQRRIAAILDKADAIRQKREEGIRLTEELLRSTFLEMFGDPATNPKEWDTEKLGELSSIRRGSSPRPIENFMGGDVPWIKIGDATKGDSFYITETEDHVTQAGAARSVLLEPGSLVVANSGVSLGFARILKIKGCVHDGWLSLEKLDDRLNKIYLLRLINSLTDHFRAIAPDGTQPNLNTGIMKEFRVAIPPIDLQRKFERAAYTIVEISAARKKAAIEAKALFGSIVQRAFRGEL